MVDLEKPASRIVAISPHLAELAYDAGAGERLIAVVRGSDFPIAVKTLPIVGDAYGIDYERLLAMQPDLVLAWGSGNRAADVRRFADRGIPVYVAEPRRLGDIARHVRAIGALAGSSEVAESAAQHFERRLDSLRKQSEPLTWLTAFVEIWPQPLFTIGPQHLISEALGLCAVRNALGGYPLSSGPVPMESVLVARPDIIVSVSGFDAVTLRGRWANVHSLKAVDSIISIDPDLMTRATPRLLLGAETLCARAQVARQTLTH